MREIYRRTARGREINRKEREIREYLREFNIISHNAFPSSVVPYI